MNNVSYDDFFSALSGNRRLDILQYLRGSGSKNVTEISEGIGMEQSAVSHNLNKLLKCEFVHLEVRGKHRYYSLNKDTIVPLFELIDKHVETFCQGTCQSCAIKSTSQTSATVLNST